jgi:hypothetical protein
MRGLTIVTISVLGLAVAACGQNKQEAAADLAAREAALNPAPVAAPEPMAEPMAEAAPMPEAEPMADAAAPEAAPAE